MTFRKLSTYRAFCIIHCALCIVHCALLTSCSETTGDEDEYANWKKRNEAFFSEIYNKAKDADGWKVISKWSLPDNVEKKLDDHIVVQVLKEGTGSGSPISTDTVRVHYSGRLIPTETYPKGFVFDGFNGELDPEVSMPSKFAVLGVVPGFSTVLQNMRIGDFWRVYIPYRLGYGEEGEGTIPGYSTLIFDINLVAYYHPGQVVPPFQGKENNTDGAPW